MAGLQEVLEIYQETAARFVGSLSEEREEASIGICMDALDFLSDGSQFPNEKINAISRDAFRLITRVDIIPFDFTNGVSKLTLGTLQGKLLESIVMVPENYLEQVKTNPLEEMAVAVGLASKLGDLAVPRLGRGDSKDSELRAGAYMAEFIQTIRERELVPAQDFWYRRSQILPAIMDKFPQGLDSLNERLRCPSLMSPVPAFRVEKVRFLTDLHGEKAETVQICPN